MSFAIALRPHIWVARTVQLGDLPTEPENFDTYGETLELKCRQEARDSCGSHVHLVDGRIRNFHGSADIEISLVYSLDAQCDEVAPSSIGPAIMSVAADIVRRS